MLQYDSTEPRLRERPWLSHRSAVAARAPSYELREERQLTLTLVAVKGMGQAQRGPRMLSRVILSIIEIVH
jgi:hypothetical protein